MDSEDGQVQRRWKAVRKQYESSSFGYTDIVYNVVRLSSEEWKGEEVNIAVMDQEYRDEAFEI